MDCAEYEVERIISHTEDSERGLLFQVKWKGYAELSTEPFENIARNYYFALYRQQQGEELEKLLRKYNYV